MKSQLRLRYILPLVLIAAAGLAVFKLGLIGGGSKAEASASSVLTTAAGATTADTTQSGATGTSATDTGTTETQPDAGATTGTGPKAESGPTGVDALTAALVKKPIVVVVVYSPHGAVDTLEVSEARLGADDGKAGFLALDATDEHAIAEFAQAYDMRLTPTVFVFRRGPEVAKRFNEFADRDTVAQAAQDARHTR